LSPVRALLGLLLFVFAALVANELLFEAYRSSTSVAGSVPVKCVRQAPELAARGGQSGPGWARFPTNGSLRLAVCSPGTLAFTAQGTTVDGNGAHLVVNWNLEVLWEGDVAETVPVQLEVPGRGWVTLAFLNDATSGEEDRNLWIRDLEFATSQ
jgi:hypothetical protein